MALTKVINDLADLNQSDSTNALKGCAGTTAQQPASSSSIEYLIVGGGGGGATNGSATGDGLGGGGAGGYVIGTGVDATTVYHGTPTVLTVGDGGNGGTTTNGYDGINGNDSGFNGIRAIGGGGGGAGSAPGLDGGSGGGGGRNADPAYHSVYYGSALDNQGNNGGSGGWTPGSYQASTGAGGGGSGEPFLDTNGTGNDGANSSSGGGGAGGSGTNINAFINSTNAALAQIGDISGSDVYVAGGGGGGAYSGTKGTGGSGGGGTGGQSGTNATSAIDNTGGGGGGDGSASSLGGDGGSGIAVLKYDNTIVTGYTLNSEDTYTVNWPADKYGVAYWPLNLDVKDVGGYYDGTATDITYTNGQFNQAASFNGSSSYIDTTFYVPPTSSLSSSVWFKTSSTAYRHCIFSDFDASGNNNSARFSLFVNASNNFEVIFGDGSASDTWNSISASSYLDGNWHNVVLTANGTALKLYVDGSLIGTDTFGVAVGTAGAQSMILGRIGGYSGGYWNGQLEQMRFYGSELSLTDVQDIYNNSKPGSLPPLKTSSDLTTESLSFPSSATTTALWDFNGDSVADPITYNGTDSNITYVNGKFGECAEFNGTNSSITVSSTLPFSSSFSISMWLNPTVLGSSGTYYLPFMSNGYPSNVGGTGIACYINGTVLDIWIGKVPAGSGTYYPIFNTGTLSTGIWQHLVLTRVYNSKWELYLNGLSLGTYNTQGLTDDFSDTSFYFGGGVSFSSPSYFYNGKIDQTRIFSSALTAQQVYDLWQKENSIQTHFTSGSTDTLVFKEGSGEITFKNDTPPGAEVGMLRYNSTLGQMEHFNSGGWKDFTNCTTYLCNYPTTATALYQFNSNATDTCGNYNGANDSGIIYGPPGKFGNGAQFGGGADRIDIDQALLGSGTTKIWSTSFWFLTSSTAEQYMNNTGAASSNSGFGIFINPTNGYLRYQTSSGSLFSPYLSLEDRSVQDGNWHHVVATYSSAGGTNDAYMYLYLDGVNVTSLCTAKNSWTQGGGATWSSFTIPRISLGNWADSSSYPGGLFPLIGSMDQLRFFNTALTQTQVTKLYNEVYCP